MTAFVTIATLLADATGRISAALALDKREARIEARVLLSHALKVDHAWLIAHDRDTPPPAQQHAIAALIERRASGEPVAYIVGEREFYGRTFVVSTETLIPRPETEILIEAALSLFPDSSVCKVLDVGVGSGVVGIALALEKPGWEVWGIDISADALLCAKLNAARLKARVSFLHGDLFEAFKRLPGSHDVSITPDDETVRPEPVEAPRQPGCPSTGAGRTMLPADTQRFDLIVSNPPYIRDDDPHIKQGDLRFEPEIALSAGIDGLGIIRRLIAAAPSHLSAGGHLLLEHGWDQAEAIQHLLVNAGFQSVHTRLDLAGLQRITGGRMP